MIYEYKIYVKLRKINDYNQQQLIFDLQFILKFCNSKYGSGFDYDNVTLWAESKVEEEF